MAKQTKPTKGKTDNSKEIDDDATSAVDPKSKSKFSDDDDDDDFDVPMDDLDGFDDLSYDDDDDF
ncbi:MAG TPA: hypothetical protein VFM79_06325 [Pelobium sp.]|nr:hypothetical protein [Pelobium sp.]